MIHNIKQSTFEYIHIPYIFYLLSIHKWICCANQKQLWQLNSALQKKENHHLMQPKFGSYFFTLNISIFFFSFQKHIPKKFCSEHWQMQMRVNHSIGLMPNIEYLKTFKLL